MGRVGFMFLDLNLSKCALGIFSDDSKLFEPIDEPCPRTFGDSTGYGFTKGEVLWKEGPIFSLVKGQEVGFRVTDPEALKVLRGLEEDGVHRLAPVDTVEDLYFVL